MISYILNSELYILDGVKVYNYDLSDMQAVHALWPRDYLWQSLHAAVVHKND